MSKFKQGSYFSRSKRFFICTACELNKTQIQDSFEEYKTELKRNQIELIKWDKLQLSRLLKDEPRIVYDFFGPEFVKAFNGNEALSVICKIPETKINAVLKSASSDIYCINNNFQNLVNSHIERKETTELYNWIFSDLKEKESNIAVLTGNAGTSKTVIIKDLIELLDRDNIPVLGLKTDKKRIDPKQYGKSILDLDSNIQNIFEQRGHLLGHPLSWTQPGSLIRSARM